MWQSRPGYGRSTMPLLLRDDWRCVLYVVVIVFAFYCIVGLELLKIAEERREKGLRKWSSRAKYIKVTSVERDLLYVSSSVSAQALSVSNYLVSTQDAKDEAQGKDGASAFCDHVDHDGIERTYFFDLSHILHGAQAHAAKFVNCSEIAMYLAYKGSRNYGKFEIGMKRFARNCLRCHKEKRRDEISFERLRERYIKRNSLNNLQHEGISRIVSSRAPEERFMRLNTEGLPVIAVGLAVCGRSTRRDEYTLISKGFPAYAQHLERGYEYWFVLGADYGDPLFDIAVFRERVKRKFNETVGSKARLLGVYAQITIIRFSNPAKKPGPAFNVVMAAAYSDGSDYFYRPNDDTIPVTQWASKFVNLLRSNRPRNFGVVGPLAITDTGGNTRILTHDFVSRVHFEIFNTYYPVSLADWTMDDWISTIYGNHHTCRLSSVKVNHTTLGQNDGNPRYQVDNRVMCLLPYEQYLADASIHQWMTENGVGFDHGPHKGLALRLSLGPEREKEVFEEEDVEQVHAWPGPNVES